MSEFGMWTQQAISRPGIVACGVKAPKSIDILSRDPWFAQSKMEELLQILAEVGAALRQDQLGGGRWRWRFENCQIHSARRADGAMALLVVKSQTAKAAAVDRLLLEFVSMEVP